MATLRKGKKILFIKRNEIETIVSTKKPNDIYVGEITTDKNLYSVDFLKRWESFGFLKVL